MKTPAPFPWFGGKSILATKIVALLPPHRSYVEPFGGSAAVLFAKPRSHFEVYNDLDEGCVTFFRVLRDQYEPLSTLLRLTPHARKEYEACRDTWTKAEHEVERARRWFVAITQSFGSSLKPTGWNGEYIGASNTPSARAWANTVTGLDACATRFMGVQVESRDWREVLERYDHDEALFYVDPPYVASTRKSGGYNHELSDDDHAELVERLCGIKGVAVVSGYEHDLYAPLEEAGYIAYRFPVITRFGSRPGRAYDPHRIEVIWRKGEGTFDALLAGDAA